MTRTTSFETIGPQSEPPAAAKRAACRRKKANVVAKRSCNDFVSRIISLSGFIRAWRLSKSEKDGYDVDGKEYKGSVANDDDVMMMMMIMMMMMMMALRLLCKKEGRRIKMEQHAQDGAEEEDEAQQLK